MFLKRKNKTGWQFKWSDKWEGWICQQRKYLYRIFFDSCGIWVGQHSPTYNSWFTVEREIRAETLIMDRGVFKFRE